MSTETIVPPTLDLDTKFGPVTLTFLVPDATKRDDRSHVLYVSGDVTINRIPVKLSMRLSLGMRRHERGAELAEPVPTLNIDWSSSYNRRTDTRDSLTSAQHDALTKLCETVLRPLYDARTDLQREARRYELAYAAERASTAEQTARDEAHKATHARAFAEQALAAFNQSHPIGA